MTIQRAGAPAVTLTYSFTFTPDVSFSIIGEYTVPRNLNGDVIDVQSRSMRTDGMGLNGLNLSTLDVLGNVATIDAAIQEVSLNLGYYGAKRREMASSIEIARTMEDVLAENIGNIVDADMAKESAKLVASQIQRQLSQQALNIANSQPTTIIGLFNPSNFN